MSDKLPVPTFSTLLATYPNTAALKDGRVRSSLLQLDFADVKVANTAFKPFIREARFDAGELAIVTYLQGRTYGKPYALLPLVVVGRGQHHTIAYNPERGAMVPGDLNGKRVGVRAYTQTTGTWVRGILAENYGVDLGSIQWTTFEEPHVLEYRDPANVERAPAGKQLVQMLLDGEIDAAIVGNELPDARLRHLIPEPEEAAHVWAEAHGGTPINHMLVVREALVATHPALVRELFRMCKESRALAAGKIDLAALPLGVEANRPSLEAVIDFAVRQHLIPKAFTVDELFSDAVRDLI